MGQPRWYLACSSCSGGGCSGGSCGGGNNSCGNSNSGGSCDVGSQNESTFLWSAIPLLLLALVRRAPTARLAAQFFAGFCLLANGVYLGAGSFVLAGYQRKLFLALVKDPDARLPEFDFGADLSAGLPVVAIHLCWYVPAMLLAFIPVVGWLAYLSLLAFVPVAVMRYYTTNRFGAAFDFAEIYEFVKAHFNNVIMMVLISWLAGMAASLGAIACIVGVFFTGFCAQLVMTCAMADTWRAAQETRSPQAPPPSPPPSDFRPSP